MEKAKTVFCSQTLSNNSKKKKSDRKGSFIFDDNLFLSSFLLTWAEVVKGEIVVLTFEYYTLCRYKI